jgi:hypothetical protein
VQQRSTATEARVGDLPGIAELGDRGLRSRTVVDTGGEVVLVGFIQPVGQLLDGASRQPSGHIAQVRGDQVIAGHGPGSNTAVTVAANSRHAARSSTNLR